MLEYNAGVSVESALSAFIGRTLSAAVATKDSFAVCFSVRVQLLVFSLDTGPIKLLPVRSKMFRKQC